MEIAVIGAGIGGLGAAWALARRHRVTVFEAHPQPGGHAHTVAVPTADGDTVNVDTGFIVYNTRTYPHLLRLFAALGITGTASRMSFAVSSGHGRIEYAGSLAGLFAQPRNVLRPDHWRMIRDVLRFYREAPAILDASDGDGESLGAYLDRNGYSDAFVADHLLPLAAAIWSAPTAAIRDFPVASFVRFLANHGLVHLRGRPRWLTVPGGSRTYVDRLTAALPDGVRTNTPVHAVHREPGGVRIDSAAATGERFDEVVVATHADQARAILGADIRASEESVLAPVRFSRNTAVLHGDPRLMPRRRRVWSSWNYIAASGSGRESKVSVSYWMNSLQPIATPELFVTLNPHELPDPRKTHATRHYDHPVLDGPALAAQRSLPHVQGRNNTWFCGAWCGYGFHEDGLESGLAVAAALGSPAPWGASVPFVSPAAAACTPAPDDPDDDRAAA